MIRTTLLVLFLGMLAPMNAQQWVKTQISENLSVEFPGQPQEAEKDGIILKQLMHPSYVVLAQITPLGAEFADAGPEDIDALYDGILEGMTSSMNTIGEPTMETFEINGHKVRKLINTMDLGNGIEATAHNILVIIDGTVTSFSFVALQEDTDTGVRDRFLNSITLAR